MIKFISDTHFNHRNIIKYTSRINLFADLDEMHEGIISVWKENVAEDDIVYHLGDFAFGSKEVVRELVSRLNGRIRLILGNHDKRNKPQWYEGLGFDRVYDTPIILDDWFIISHEPIKYLTDAMPYVNIHGHTHDEEYANFQRINVCWEVLEGVPVTFDEIKDHFINLEALNQAGKMFVENRHTENSMNYNEGYGNGYQDGLQRRGKL